MITGYNGQIYQGSCKGVGKSFPSTFSAVPISLVTVTVSLGFYTLWIHTYPGPRGAQNWPVLLISKSLANDTSDSAAWSGVTATTINIHSIHTTAGEGVRGKTYHRQHPKTCRIPHSWSSPSA